MVTDINLDTWEGKSMYNHFSAMDIPFYSITTRLDANELLRVSKKYDISFFSLCLYGITHAVNSIEAFRYRTLENGNIVLHDQVQTSYIIQLYDERITTVYAPLEKNFHLFCLEQKKREQALKSPVYNDRKDRGIAFFSCVPWLDFTSGSHPVNIGTRYDSIPRFTLGRYTHNADGNISMPFDMHMHHGFVDGFKVATLLRSLDGIWHKLCSDIEKSG